LTKTGTGTPASLSYWSQDCTGPGACSITIATSNAVTATFSHTNYVFVTATSHDGDWGGNLANADAFCNADAASAGLPGNYVAWISNSSTTAGSRLGQARGWMRIDGRPFADTVATLTSTNPKIFYPPMIDALGNTLDRVLFIATGTNGNGGSESQNCNNWTTNDNSPMSGGIASGGSGEWSDGAGALCSASWRWYCMGTNFATAVAPTPVAVRKAFLLSAPWIPDQGIANADERCRNDAAQFGLANPTAFRALLATTSASASSRFNLASAPWVRTDGVQVVAAAADIATGKLMAPIAVGPDGVTTLRDPTGFPMLVTVGIIGWANPGMFGWNPGWFCIDPNVRVYCLEN
jgi:hypothetical protein